MVDQLDVPDVARALGLFRQGQQDQLDTRNRNALLDLRRQGIDIQKEGLGIQRDAAGRAQSNADRLFGLNTKRFDASQANADRQFDFTKTSADRQFDLANRKLTADSKTKSANAGKTAMINNFERAQQDGFQGTFFDFQRQLAEAKGGGKPITDAQAKAAGFAERMLASNQIVNDPDVAAAGLERFDSAVGDLPVIGSALQSEEGQKLDQAKRDFINAILRRESGAVIAESEFNNAEKQYFPQPGDTQAKLSQKARNRELAIKGIVRAAGPAAQGLTAQSETAPGGVIDAADFFK